MHYKPKCGCLELLIKVNKILKRTIIGYICQNDIYNGYAYFIIQIIGWQWISLHLPYLYNIILRFIIIIKTQIIRSDDCDRSEKQKCARCIFFSPEICKLNENRLYITNEYCLYITHNGSMENRTRNNLRRVSFGLLI